jgi:glycosyltransferase involved in cell wall biosynthesis
MNIAIVTHERTPNDFGLNLQIDPLFKGLGFKVYLIARGFFGEIPSNEPYRVLPPEFKFKFKIIKYLKMQLNICKIIINNSHKFDILFFHVGSDLILPIVLSKILGKTVYLELTGSLSQCLDLGGSRRNIFSNLFLVIERINYILSDNIFIYGESSIKFFCLDIFKNKVVIAAPHFYDINAFKMIKKPSNRDYNIGYVGRLSEEKGVLNFIESIPTLLEKIPDLEIIIVGDGNLLSTIIDFSEKKGIGNRMHIIGDVPHDKIPEYLNKLKLLILPSYSEGLPNILLEAMACGTPVLVTPVGNIPDIIKNGKNGFILKENSPECITNEVLNILRCKNVDDVAENARSLIETDFTQEAAIAKWEKFLCTQS